MNLTLIDAFRRFGAKPASRLSSLSAKGGSHHVRPDLTGKIVEFDGDRFVVDFTRPHGAPPALTGRRK